MSNINLPPRCARCINFDRSSDMDARGRSHGICRAEPPKCDPAGGNWAAFPKVLSSDWCGRFAERRAAA